MAVSVLVTILGVVLISVTFFDVFITVLHPQAESPFSSRLQTSTWRVLRLVTRPLRGRWRHRVLGLAIPLLIVVLVGVWVTLMAVAFGLIYAAWIGVPGGFNIPEQGDAPGFADALYFSGVTLGTIGYGDFQPVHPLLRLASVVEGFTGVAVLSMSIAYVLEVYPVLQRKSVLAVLLNEETDGQVNGLPMLSRYLHTGNFEALASLLRMINLELLFLAEAHRRLPVLYYGHPTEPERSFLRVLLVVQNLVAALRYGTAAGVGRQWSQDPRVRDLEDSLFYALYTLGSSLHLTLKSRLVAEEFEAQAAIAFKQLCNDLAALKLPTPSTTVEAAGGLTEYERAYAGFRRFHIAGDTALVSYMLNSGYTYAEATRAATRPEKLVSDLDSELP